MKKIFIVTEGPSEEHFAKAILAPHFLDYEKIIIPITILTKRDNRHGIMYKGGMSSYSKMQNSLEPVLKRSSRSEDSYVSTMVDFYALPTDTPGYANAMKYSDAYDKVRQLENSILQKVGHERHFKPYIQLHEFEALLFADIEQLSTEYFDCQIDELRQAISTQPNPELINNSFETAPSKRILKAIPAYDKTVAGIEVLRRIGLNKIRDKCRHFNDWITHLEQI